MAPEETKERTPPKDAPPSESANADVGAAVEELLNSLSSKFATISSEMFAKMDEMSRRLDNLEAALRQQKASKEGGGSSSNTP
ncbi:heat shock factor binding protein 1 domain-containing protein [Ophiocordyceps camponoti-floridani]|uniref:Heat shock factor binding protein 1 domain-containing protein n=1 Tax=Ophiocordyceps camponoti-floridani TaxID=2030778 RepID=A0A8H4Q5H9_9HYPO|nr:heat shock factor binding protein 1 domain-containing protein [Ophiocordyceps camponoti-floridani]